MELCVYECSYNMIKKRFSPFYAQVAQKAFLYLKRRFTSSLGYATYFLVIFVIWNVIYEIVYILYQAVRDEIAITKYRQSDNPVTNNQNEKVKKD